MDILLAILIQWLSLNANITIDTPPLVEIVSPQELVKKYGAPAYALYSKKDATIYLADTIDLKTIEGASILLHELVHHYQNVSGAMDGYSCIRESEHLAYATQRDYLITNKATVLPELDEFNILMRSLCETAYH